MTSILVNPDPETLKAYEDATKAVEEAVAAKAAYEATPDADAETSNALNDTIVELTRQQMEAYEAVQRSAPPARDRDLVSMIWLKDGKVPTISDFRILRAGNAPIDHARPIPLVVTKRRAVQIAKEPTTVGRKPWFLDGAEIIPVHAVVKRFS